MNKKDLEREVFELVGDKYASNSVITIKALEAACLIIDDKFGPGFSISHPELAVSMTETIMGNIRLNDLHSTIKNEIGERLDAIKGLLVRDVC